MARILIYLGVCFVSFFPGLAYAHAALLTPEGRSESDNLTTAPCGGVAKTKPSTANVYLNTQPIKVTIHSHEDHQGDYQIILRDSDDGDALQTQTVPGGGKAGNITVDFVVPTGKTCDNCTLQLIQFGTSGGGTQDPYYYSCADIKLTSNPAEVSDAGASASHEHGHSGCSICPCDKDKKKSVWAWIGLGLGAVLLVRRRRHAQHK